MKNQLILTCALCLVLAACQQKTDNNLKSTVASFNEAKEKEAILQTIADETACYFKKDYNCWQKCYAHSEFAFQAWNNLDGSFDAFVGWNDLDAHSGKYIRDNPLSENEAKDENNSFKAERRNMKIKFYNENVAYLIWDQYNLEANAKKYTHSKETRLMEKTSEGWKIVNVTALWDYKNLISIASLK